MTLTRRSIMLAGGAALIGGCARGPDPILASGVGGEPVFAFEHITIAPAQGKSARRNHTVLVRNGRIEAVGPSSQIRVPLHAIRIGRDGQFLMPGLVDMHVHLLNPDHGVLLLASGVTTVRNMWGQQSTLDLIAAIGAGEIPGPTIYSSGPLIDGHDSVWQGVSIADTPEDARRLVAETAAAGFIAVKLYARLQEPAFRAATEEAHRLGLQVYCHVPDAMTLEQVLEIGVDSIEHLEGHEFALNPNAEDHSYPARERVWAGADASLIAPLAARLAASRVWNTPTLIARIGRARSYADMTAALARPEIQLLDDQTAGFWKSIYESRRNTDLQRALAEAEAGHAVRMQLVKALSQAGAGLMIGTDMPNPFVFPGTSYHEELAFYERAGLSRQEILTLATAAPAAFLRKSDEFGAVKTGARADLLLLDGDPGADLGVLRRPAGVMAAGRWRDAAALDELRRGVAKRARNAG